MRSSFLLIALFLVAACGFRPVHAPVSSSQNAVLQYIMVDNIPTRSGQILKIELEDLLHPDGQYPQPRYRLAVNFSEEKQPIVIESNARVSRYNLILKADYTLIDLTSGATVHQGSVKRLSSYNSSLSDFSTYVAEGDALNRGVKQLAHDVANRLIAFLKT